MSGGEPEDLREAAVRALERLIAAGDHSRTIAADLLAVDSLATWACEAAAERWAHGDADPDALIQWSADFAQRIGAVAATPADR